ncbi:MAG: hypothetical protein IIY06_05985, partial [Proteobacteria bacterium]|nr:hypothetical protein [Pseudomonadota bacterium]
ASGKPASGGSAHASGKPASGGSAHASGKPASGGSAHASGNTTTPLPIHAIKSDDCASAIRTNDVCRTTCRAAAYDAIWTSTLHLIAPTARIKIGHCTTR